MTNASAEKPITIKKYANRRLYNTATSSYVTLDNLAQMVKQNEEFVVFDAKTGEDITRAVLTQIIVEEEGKGGQNLLADQLPAQPDRLLRRFAAAGCCRAISNYSMGALPQPRGADAPISSRTCSAACSRSIRSRRLNKQNMALFDSAMKMWAPFYGAPGTQPGGPNGAGGAPGQLRARGSRPRR